MNSCHSAEEPKIKNIKYPVYSPEITKNDIKEITRTLEKGWVSIKSPIVLRFEDKFREFINTKAAIACSSGTAAIELSLRALGIKSGDEVIIPDFTFVQVANAVIRVGAIPVPVDSLVEHPNMDLDRAERVINKRTKAVIAVHTYGKPLDFNKLLRLRKTYNLLIIEDCAESLGSKYSNKRMTGSLGDTACFSLYANKLITAGEGGVVTALSKKTGELLKAYRNHGFTEKYHFWHSIQGYNFKPTAMQIAFAYSQLKRIRQMIMRKKLVTKLYLKYLKGIEGISLPFINESADVLCWVFPLIVKNDFPMNRDRLRYYLAGQGIETRSFFYPISIQPCFKNMFINVENKNSIRFANTGLYLPSSPLLKEKDIETICRYIGKASKK